MYYVIESLSKSRFCPVFSRVDHDKPAFIINFTSIDFYDVTALYLNARYSPTRLNGHVSLAGGVQVFVSIGYALNVFEERRFGGQKDLEVF